MKPWTSDGHQKQDFAGLTVQASQFQLPDGTVICDDMTTINITIEKIEIKNSKLIGVKEICEPDDDDDKSKDDDEEE